MHWEEVLLHTKGSLYIGVASVALLILGFLFDISTSQALVVAITYNIPSSPGKGRPSPGL